jgi:hypothetical protein
MTPPRSWTTCKAKGVLPRGHQGRRPGAGQGRADLRELRRGRGRREGDHAGQKSSAPPATMWWWRSSSPARRSACWLYRRQGGQAHGVQHGPQARQRPATPASTPAAWAPSPPTPTTPRPLRPVHGEDLPAHHRGHEGRGLPLRGAACTSA